MKSKHNDSQYGKAKRKERDACRETTHSIKVKVAFTNADSILNKLPELHQYLLSSKPDLLAVVETNCTDSYPASLLATQGYSIHRFDNNTERRGGILVFVKDTFEVKLCHELKPCTDQLK